MTVTLRIKGKGELVGGVPSMFSVYADEQAEAIIVYKGDMELGELESLVGMGYGEFFDGATMLSERPSHPDSQAESAC